MNMEAVIVPNAYCLKELGGEVMVTSESMDDILIVNELGARILQRISEGDPITVGAVVEMIGREYRADTVEEDVLAFLEEMKESGVISVLA